MFTFFKELPVEIQPNVLSFLSAKELGQNATVAKNFVDLSIAASEEFKIMRSGQKIFAKLKRKRKRRGALSYVFEKYLRSKNGLFWLGSGLDKYLRELSAYNLEILVHNNALRGFQEGLYTIDDIKKFTWNHSPLFLKLIITTTNGLTALREGLISIVEDRPSIIVDAVGGWGHFSEISLRTILSDNGLTASREGLISILIDEAGGWGNFSEVSLKRALSDHSLEHARQIKNDNIRRLSR